MESPALAWAPSPTTRSSMTSSVGATSPGKSISGLVVLGSKPMMIEPFSDRSRVVDQTSDDSQDVDDEHQGVFGPDQRRRTLGAITIGRGHDQQDSAAHGLSDQALVPAGDDLAGPDLSVEGRAVVSGGVKLLPVLPQHTGVVDLDVLASLDYRTGALDQRLDDQLGRGRDLGDRDLRGSGASDRHSRKTGLGRDHSP